eukprot:scaffold830_cov112-Isochrysis_galbana.AAC.13
MEGTLCQSRIKAQGFILTISVEKGETTQRNWEKSQCESKNRSRIFKISDEHRSRISSPGVEKNETISVKPPKTQSNRKNAVEQAGEARSQTKRTPNLRRRKNAKSQSIRLRSCKIGLRSCVLSKIRLRSCETAFLFLALCERGVGGHARAGADVGRQRQLLHDDEVRRAWPRGGRHRQPAPVERGRHGDGLLYVPDRRVGARARTCRGSGPAALPRTDQGRRARPEAALRMRRRRRGGGLASAAGPRARGGAV